MPRISSPSQAGGGSRPRALFVAADVPWPLDGGGRIATFRSLRAFSRLYDTDLVALADPMGELDTSELRRLCRQVILVKQPFTFRRHFVRQAVVALRSLFSLEPYRLRKFHSQQASRILSELRRRNSYSIVHFDGFGVAPYWMPGIPSSHMCQNVESDIYRRGAADSRDAPTRLWAWQEGVKLRRAERRLLPHFDVVFALADEDAELLRKAGARRVRVIPMPAPQLRAIDRPPQDPTLLSLGTMSWFGVEEGLLWFRREVYPIVREMVPTVRWDLVGPNAGPSIRRLDGIDGVRVCGYVEDLGPVLEATRAAIVPLHIAGGIRMKLLGLMAAGVPSVSTTLGARGLAFGDGEGCFRRDDPLSFAEAVVALLTRDDLWMHTARLGQEYVTRNHSDERLVETLEEALSPVIEQGGR